MAALVLNANEATKSVRIISELIENIGSAASTYRAIVEDQFQRTDLQFLNTIASAMGQIETNIKQLSNTCIDIQTALSKYIREFEAYSDDTSGLGGN